MTYTPVELRHVRVGRSLFGYNRATVEQVIEEVAQSFEATWRERGELAERVEELEKQLAEHREREQLLTQTLLAAEQAASDVRERARREADAIIAEAHNEARAIGRSAHAKRERLITDSQRIEAMLRSALGVVEESMNRVPPATPAPKATDDLDPAREVVTELEPVPVPVPLSVPEAEVPTPALALPPVIDDQPVPAGDWREDTREFAPIVMPETIDEPEPSSPVVEEPAERVLQRTMPGHESRDFDWGE